MPLKPGASKAVRQKNFHEFRHGPKYAAALKKGGPKAANKLMIAVVLGASRPKGKKKGRNGTKTEQKFTKGL